MQSKIKALQFVAETEMFVPFEVTIEIDSELDF